MKSLFGMLLFIAGAATAQDSSFTSTEIIYGRKDGMALTLLKITPKQHGNGKGVISLVSGNWNSSYSMTASAVRHSTLYIDRGYTVFLVIHGSQPRYNIADEIEDARRAVRFVRYNAASYSIDPDHIGITGASSGGHLSLVVALKDDKPTASATDPVDRVSSRVQAAAVFFPPTDFLHWGNFSSEETRQMMIKARIAGAFDFKKMNDTTGVMEHIRDEKLKDSIAKAISPIYMVSADDPPVMIAHGDADPIVPLQQSQSIIQKLKQENIPAELIVKQHGNHGWRDSETEQARFIDWFDKWLK